MAEGNKHFHEFGYPDERFEFVLSDNLHCAICSYVLKDPVMCKNEHCFCRGCITKHLENYYTCFSCNQDLTVESLAVAPRIVRNLLSGQKIRCDYYERGCEEIVQLGNLASHVAVCGKTPVVCANEKCSSEINREDQFRHESEECRFREVKCRNCKDVSVMLQEIETSLGGLCEHVKKLNTNVNEQVEKLNTSVKEMKSGLIAVKNRFENVENRFEEMEIKFKDRLQEMENMFENSFEEMKNKFEPQYANAYVVAGGYDEEGKPLNSAEIFDKTTKSWIQPSPMKKSRAEASAVVYNGQILVTGGTSDDNSIVTSTEQLYRDANPFVPPIWSYFPVNLPRALGGHRTVLYNNRMFVIGGYDEEKRMCSYTIYEIQLHFPFNTKILAKLPSSTPTTGCGVVLSNDNILIFGGCNRSVLMNPTAKVTMYNVTKNEFKELAPLPYGLRNMATVKMGENVILVGGANSFLGGEKNTILSYNIDTQKITELPPMKRVRSECCAVVDGNSLVVMGGQQQRSAPLLNSVEAFDFKTSTWSDLPLMNEARRIFVAEIV